MNVEMRWLIRRDMPQVLDIERRACGRPWSEGNYMDVLRQKNTIGMVAEPYPYRDGTDLVGSMVYELHRNSLHLLRVSVDPECQRQGVGTAMIDKLKDKLSNQRRTHMAVIVPERSLDVLLFLKSQGFWADDMHHDWDEDGDGIEMSYHVGSEWMAAL